MSDSRRSRTRHSPASSYSGRTRSTAQSVSNATDTTGQSNSTGRHTNNTNGSDHHSYFSSIHTEQSHQSSSTNSVVQRYEPNFLSSRRNTDSIGRMHNQSHRRVNIYDLYNNGVVDEEENGFLGNSTKQAGNIPVEEEQRRSVPVVAVSKYLTRVNQELGDLYGDHDSEYEEEENQSTRLNKRQKEIWLENSKYLESKHKNREEEPSNMSEDSDGEYVDEISSSSSEEEVEESDSNSEEEEKEESTVQKGPSSGSLGISGEEVDELYYPGDTSSEEEEEEDEDGEEVLFDDSVVSGFVDLDLDLIPEQYTVDDDAMEEDEMEEEDDEDDYQYGDENDLEDMLYDEEMDIDSDDNDDKMGIDATVEDDVHRNVDNQHSEENQGEEDDEFDEEFEILSERNSSEDEGEQSSLDSDSEEEEVDLWDDHHQSNNNSNNNINTLVPPISVSMDQPVDSIHSIRGEWLSYLRTDVLEEDADVPFRNDADISVNSQHEENLANQTDDDWSIDWEEESITTTIHTAPIETVSNTYLQNTYQTLPKATIPALNTYLTNLTHSDSEDEDDDEYLDTQPMSKRSKRSNPLKTTRVAALSLLSQLADMQPVDPVHPVVETKPKLIFKQAQTMQFGITLANIPNISIRTDGQAAYIFRTLEYAPQQQLLPAICEYSKDWSTIARTISTYMYSSKSIKSAIYQFLSTAHGLSPDQDVGMKPWIPEGQKKPTAWVSTNRLYIQENTNENVLEKQKQQLPLTEIPYTTVLRQPEHLLALLGVQTALCNRTTHFLQNIGGTTDHTVSMHGQGTYRPSSTSVYTQGGVKQWYPVTLHPNMTQFKHSIRLPIQEQCPVAQKQALQHYLLKQEVLKQRIHSNATLLPLQSDIDRNPLRLSSNKDMTQVIGVVPNVDATHGMEVVASDIIQKWRSKQFYSLSALVHADNELKSSKQVSSYEDIVTKADAALNRDWSQFSARQKARCHVLEEHSLASDTEAHITTVYGRIVARSHIPVYSGLQRATAVDSVSVGVAQLWSSTQEQRLCKQTSCMQQQTYQHSLQTQRETQKYHAVGKKKVQKEETPDLNTIITKNVELTVINNISTIHCEQTIVSPVLTCYPQGIKIPCIDPEANQGALYNLCMQAIAFSGITSVKELVQALTTMCQKQEYHITRGEQAIVCMYHLSQYNILYNRAPAYTFSTLSCPSMSTCSMFREVPLFTRPADLVITLNESVQLPPQLAYNFAKYVLPSTQFDTLQLQSIQQIPHGCVLPILENPINQRLKRTLNTIYSTLIPEISTNPLCTPGAGKLFASVSGRVMAGEYLSVPPATIDPLVHILVQEQQSAKQTTVYYTSQCAYNQPVLTVPVCLATPTVPLVSHYQQSTSRFMSANPKLFLRNTFIPSYVCFSGLCKDICVCRYAPLTIETPKQTVHTFITSPMPFLSTPIPRVPLVCSAIQQSTFLSLLQLLVTQPVSRQNLSSVQLCHQMSQYIPKYALHPALQPLQDLDQTAHTSLPAEQIVPVSQILSKPSILSAKQMLTQRMLSQHGVLPTFSHYGFDKDTVYSMYSHLTQEVSFPFQSRVLYASKWNYTDYTAWQVNTVTKQLKGHSMYSNIHTQIESQCSPVDMAIPVIHQQQWRQLLSGQIDIPLFLSMMNVRQLPKDPASLYNGLHVVYTPDIKLEIYGRRLLTNLMRISIHVHDEDITTTQQVSNAIPKELLVMYPMQRRFQTMQANIHFIRPAIQVQSPAHPLSFAYPRHSGVPWVVLSQAPFFVLQQFQKSFIVSILQDLGLTGIDILGALDLNFLFQNKTITFAQIYTKNPFHSAKAALEVFTASCQLIHRPDLKVKIILKKYPPPYNVSVDQYKQSISKWQHMLMTYLELTNLPKLHSEEVSKQPRVLHNEIQLNKQTLTNANLKMIPLQHVHSENTLFQTLDEDNHPEYPYSSLYQPASPILNTVPEHQEKTILPRSVLLGSSSHHPIQANYLRNRRDLLTPKCTVNTLAFLHEDWGTSAELLVSNIIQDEGRVTRSRTNALPKRHEYGKKTISDLLNQDEMERVYNLPPQCPPVPTSRALFVKYKPIKLNK